MCGGIITIMSSQIRIFKVSAELEKSQFDIKVSPWKLLIETNRYYEIKPENGPVKRIYKEKLNTVVEESKSYTNGFLSCSAFCIEDQVNDMKMLIVQNLQLKIKDYMNELQLNQKAIEQKYLLF